MKNIVMIIFGLAVVAIGVSSFSRLSESIDDTSAILKIQFPEDYGSWARIDSIGEVGFPEGYRSWTHVKTAVLTPSHPSYSTSGGFHHIYANPLAMEGYRTGKFPNGAIMVVDFIEMIDGQTIIDEGKRRYVDVMMKDTARYSETGGWGFTEFDGSSKSIRRVSQANAHAACYTCHTRRATNDFVFSQYRE